MAGAAAYDPGRLVHVLSTPIAGRAHFRRLIRRHRLPARRILCISSPAPGRSLCRSLVTASADLHRTARPSARDPVDRTTWYWNRIDDSLRLRRHDRGRVRFRWIICDWPDFIAAAGLEVLGCPGRRICSWPRHCRRPTRPHLSTHEPERRIREGPGGRDRRRASPAKPGFAGGAELLPYLYAL